MNPVEIIRRYRTLATHRIRTLPIAILMPHSTCNCRCVMCDIWKDNANRRQLDEAALRSILSSLKSLSTERVVLSGGEALMHPRLFDFCDILHQEKIKITLLSSGLLLGRFTDQILGRIDEVIVSLDGSEPVHDAIRGIPQGYQKLADGVKALKSRQPGYKISGRCVIQQLNFHDLPRIITSAHELGLDRISFLAADVSTAAFNRAEEWSHDRKNEILLSPEQLAAFEEVLGKVTRDFASDFSSGFIAESPEKLYRILSYYRVRLSGQSFNAPRCTAPWVSAVVEADGTVRPCYFHKAYGNLSEAPLREILNSDTAIAFRRKLDIASDGVCRNCVCWLNLRPYDRVP